MSRQSTRDMKVEFEARFQAKQARREATKAAKQDPLLKKQIQDLLKKGETQKAYQKAKVLLAKQALAQQMDQIADMAELSAAQIQANTSMNRMTHMMASSSRVMNIAQKNTNPEKVRFFFILASLEHPVLRGYRWYLPVHVERSEDKKRKGRVFQ